MYGKKEHQKNKTSHFVSKLPGFCVTMFGFCLQSKVVEIYCYGDIWDCLGIKKGINLLLPVRESNLNRWK